MTEPSTTATKTHKPLIDYSSLQAEDVDVKTVRPATVESTPFREWYAESKASGKGKSFVVPTVAAPQTVSLLRKAASLVDGGIQIGQRDLGNGRVQVTFAATVKKAYDPSKPRKPIAPKRRKTESPKDYKARQDKYNVALQAWNRANPA